jgi:XapX domain-containing protein
MKTYLVTLALGVLVGAIYGLFQVRSPAPPVIALVGLLGILLGEQVPPLVRHWFSPPPAQQGFVDQQVKPHMFGALPCGPNTPKDRPA